MSSEQPIDVGALLAELRSQVRASRASLSDDSPHAAQIRASFDELRDAVAEVEALRAVSAHWPLTWHTQRQRVVVFVQRLIRRGLKWYIAPIVEQQNAYNNAVARALQLLVDSNQQLAAEVARLQQERRVQTAPLDDKINISS
jgi:hypothetical protein